MEPADNKIENPIWYCRNRNGSTIIKEEPYWIILVKISYGLRALGNIQLCKLYKVADTKGLRINVLAVRLRVFEKFIDPKNASLRLDLMNKTASSGFILWYFIK
jgi:hypothetical protein